MTALRRDAFFWGLFLISVSSWSASVPFDWGAVEGSRFLTVRSGDLRNAMITPIDPTGSGKVNWQDAYTTCHSLQYAGHHDWQLPPENVLQNLADSGLNKVSGYENATVWSDFHYVWTRQLSDEIGFEEELTSALNLKDKSWDLPTNAVEPGGVQSGTAKHDVLCVRTEGFFPNYERCYLLHQPARCLCIAEFLGRHDFSCN